MWVYKYLFELLLSFILVISPEVELLGHMVSSVCLFRELCRHGLLFVVLADLCPEPSREPGTEYMVSECLLN